MSVKLQNKIKAVKSRRFNFMLNWFNEELNNGGINPLEKLNILIEKKINPLGSDYGSNNKTVFTKKFIEFYIKELNIKDQLCKKILKKIRFERISKDISKDIDNMNKINILYNNTYLESLNKEEWDCIEKLLSEYKKIKKLFLDEKERKKIIGFKQTLCQLTDCYKNPEAIKVICEKCGILLQPETEFCPECRAEIKD